MLHILLLILKIVGIILAAVLCLAILAASVLILNPAVYRFDASAEERADITGILPSVTPRQPQKAPKSVLKPTSPR